MQTIAYKYLRPIYYKDVSTWNVERFLNNKTLQSKHKLVLLRTLIFPKKNVVKKDDYDGILPIVDKIVFKTGKVVFRKKKTTGMNLYLLNKGDLLVSNINFHQGATALNTFGDIVATTHYQPYTINSELVNSDYLIKILRSPTFLELVSGRKAQGIKNESGYDFIGSFLLPLPSLSEQYSIIKEYNAIIQEANKIEQEAIAIENGNSVYLRQQLGASIIKDNNDKRVGYKYLHFARFRSIDEWGNEVILKKLKQESFKYPIVKIKDLCHVGSGGTPSRSNQQYYNGDIPWVKTGEVVNDEIFETEEHITNEAIANCSAKLYPKGSVIIAMYGQGDTRGRTAKLAIDATTNQACAVLYDIDNTIVSTDYLWYYLQGRYHDLRSLASGNNQPNLNAGKIKNYDVVVPPMCVQNEIVAHIKEQKALAKSLRQRAQILRQEALTEFETKIFE